MIYLAFDRFWNNTPVAGEWAKPNPWGPQPVIASLLKNYPERFALAHTSKLLAADVRFAYMLKWRYYYGYGAGQHAEQQAARIREAFAWLLDHPILPGLRNGKIKLVFIDWWEGEIDPTTDILSGNDHKFQVLAEFLNVPIKSIVFVHANADAPARAASETAPAYIYENVFENVALMDANNRRASQGPIGDHPLDKPFRFLSYSRHWNEYRQLLTLEFFARGIDKFGLISCGAADSKDPAKNKQRMWREFEYWANSDAELERLRGQIPDFLAKLPLVLDHDLTINLVHHVTYEHFLQTDLSFINETWVNDRTVFISEKTFKTISLKHPFLLLGNPGTLAHLRELGYKTFWPYLDEAYDDEHHLPTRKNKLLKVLTDFCNLEPEYRFELRQRLDEIANFNYEHFMQAETRNTFGRNIVPYLSSIFEREYLGAV